MKDMVVKGPEACSVRRETMVVGALEAGKVGENATKKLSPAVWCVNGESQKVCLPLLLLLLLTTPAP